MFRTILRKIDKDKDYPARVYSLDVLSRVRDGALYDVLPYGFHTEKDDSGQYVPLRERRPSVRYNLCKMVVEDSVALLFSEGHFPTVETADKSDTEGRDALMKLVKACKLNETMIEAATEGSVGSVAVLLRVLKQKDKSHRAFLSVHSTKYLTPRFDPQAPDTLIGMVEKYKVNGEDLRAAGYPIDSTDYKTRFWFSREWTDGAETWFVPWKLSDEATEGFSPTVDAERTVKHDLGFVPWVWVRNLPGKLRLLEFDGAPVYSDVDGACTFDAAIESMIEIEYLWSQGGRGLKYTMDPLLVLKEPPSPDRDFVKSPSNALVIDADGDAKLLEIGGSAFTVVLDWIRALREFALENVHGNRADASKLAAAQSGRAMELMNQALIWLADKLRTSYGEGAYRQLIEMMIRAHAKYPLSVNGAVLPPLKPDMQISLNWPAFFAPTNRDLQEQAVAIKTLRESAVISRQTAIANVAFAYDVEDVAAELARIQTDEKAELDMLAARGAQITEQVRKTE